MKPRYAVLRSTGFKHVFKVGGPVPWSRVLLPFYRKKLDRSTQFDAVGYIITLCSSKGYVKSWGVRSNFLGGPDTLPLTRQWLCLGTSVGYMVAGRPTATCCRSQDNRVGYRTYRLGQMRRSRHTIQCCVYTCVYTLVLGLLSMGQQWRHFQLELTLMMLTPLYKLHTDGRPYVGDILQYCQHF